MFEQYFVKPTTIDRFRGSWIGPQIEKYLVWLVENGYSSRTIWRRTPIGYAFGELAGQRGANSVADLPEHVEEFVADRVAKHQETTRSSRPMGKEIRGPVEQMLSVVLPGFEGTGRRHHSWPLVDVLPGFPVYLSNERGLGASSLVQYQHHLSRFEAYLLRIGVIKLTAVSPAILSAYMVERSAAGLSKSTVRSAAGVLRVFLRYAHREGLVASDLSGTVGWPQCYRLSDVPRSTIAKGLPQAVLREIRNAPRTLHWTLMS